MSTAMPSGNRSRGPRLTTKVITLKQACEFIEAHHRHHGAPVGHKFSIGVRVEGSAQLVGVAVVGRPVAAALDDGGETLEVSRSATDGTRNANSALYGAAWRVCRAMGARRLITYTQDGESGASLKAAGFTPIAVRRPHSGWNRTRRARQDRHPTQIARTLWLRGEPFPQRHETTDECHKTLRPQLCSQCGQVIEQPATGRVRRTCSDACRARASRRRRANAGAR
ncbi:XF1762 family protein [Nocardia beijingensis]|uniref:XF1762 family protein n=1 Tax=Nocardia beijingensis TaxID=95162 RepID=UPI00332AC3F6